MKRYLKERWSIFQRVLPRVSQGWRSRRWPVGINILSSSLALDLPRVIPSIPRFRFVNMVWIVERRPCVGDGKVSAKDGREPKKSPFIGAAEVAAFACYSYEPRHVPGFFIWYAFYDFSRATSLASASLYSHQIEATCMLIDPPGHRTMHEEWLIVLGLRNRSNR